MILLQQKRTILVTYPEGIYDCDGVTCINDTDGDGVCDELETSGCTDETACNYNSSATDDDGMRLRSYKL